MATDLLKISRNRSKPPRIIIYGPPGIGKTTLACNSPNCVVMNVEGGLGELDVAVMPEDPYKFESYDDLIDALKCLGKFDSDIKTVIVDTLDWVEPLIWQKVCDMSNVSSIEKADGGYGKGYITADKIWDEFFNLLTALRNEKGMTIIMTAHSSVEKFNDPLSESYDVYRLKLHKRAFPKAEEFADVIAFCNIDPLTKTEGKDEKARSRVMKSSKRTVHLIGCPAYTAKNRYSMPESLPMDWAEIAQYLPKQGKN
jgi:hypothetical protein